MKVTPIRRVQASPYADTVWLLQANIDDQTPEQLSFAAELLMQNGALDCWFEPIYMKKGRPAIKLCVLCKRREQEKLCRLLFQHTSTIGIRKSKFQRQIMQRSFVDVHTIYGDVQVKVCRYHDIEKHSVEFESAKRAALAHHVSIEQVMRETLSKFCD